MNAYETAIARLREAGLRDGTYQRDRWQEARAGAALRFHASADDRSPGYWAAVYKRWAQLYETSMTR